MKKLFSLILLTIFLKNADAQKMYIWCPNKLVASPRTEQLKNIEINLLINDTRILTEKSKNECTSDELTNSLFTLIKATYPSATINKLTDGKKKIEDGKIFIEINITAYYATFTTPMWFAQTGYSVKITDSRNGSKKDYSQDIQKEKKFFNVGGYGTAKNNLNKSYMEANMDLLSLLADKLNN